MFAHVQSLMNPCQKGLRSVQFLQHPESEEKYIQCSTFGQMFIFTCPTGLHWSQSKMACDRKNFLTMFSNGNPSTNFNHGPEQQQPQPQQFQQSAARSDFSRPILTNNEIRAEIIATTPFTPTITTTTTTQFTPMNNFANVLHPTPKPFEVETSSIPKQKEFVEQKGHCGVVSVSGSVFSIVNGVYSMINTHLYRRSDNLQLPGLIVKTSETQWCVTFSFSTANLDDLTSQEVLRMCGTNLECCMLISESNSGIDDINRVWIVNILENRGKQDGNIKIGCNGLQKGWNLNPFFKSFFTIFYDLSR